LLKAEVHRGCYSRPALACLLIALTSLGCARRARVPVHALPKRHEAPVPVPQGPQLAPGAPVLEAARGLLGAKRIEHGGRHFNDDCSGFVRASFSAVDVDLFSLAPELPGENGVRLIHAFVERYGFLHQGPMPLPGDLVFFDDTWDRNRNGVLDDPLTHIGIVESIEPGGTFVVLHRNNRGVVREPMNLERPHDAVDELGRPLNAWLRGKLRGETPGTPHLMGELFAGFGAVGVPAGWTGPRFDELAVPEPEYSDLPPPPMPLD
jgi:hypothetical protein